MSELHVAIMRVHRVQAWFLHQRGVPLIRWGCPQCKKERLFTIWSDGKYHCLACLYRQVMDGRDGPVDLVTDPAVMEDFADSWVEYRRQAELAEDPWIPSENDILMIAHLMRLRPPPVCTVGECEKCKCIRPFMRREDGDAGCIHCLMHGRIVEFEIEVADQYAAA